MNKERAKFVEKMNKERMERARKEFESVRERLGSNASDVTIALEYIRTQSVKR